MPDIATPIVFPAELRTLVTDCMCKTDFTAADWQSEELEPLRKFIRDYYRQAQGGLCSYCRNPISIISAANCQVEHIAPKSIYIQFIFDERNLCVICADCNTIKRNQEVLHEIPDTLKRRKANKKYPKSSGAFKIVHPHFDDWDDHIIQFASYYVDKTPKGSFTINACVLNRRLHAFGWEKEVVDTQEVSALMSAFLSSKDPLQQLDQLTKLKKLLLTI